MNSFARPEELGGRGGGGIDEKQEIKGGAKGKVPVLIHGKRTSRSEWRYLGGLVGEWEGAEKSLKKAVGGGVG